jgi:glycine oxidase
VSRAAADVVVVGGGAIGLASAWRLAQQGATVTVVDPAPGSGASTVAAGMLAPVTEARPGEEALLKLGLESLGLWPAFAAELEGAAGQAIGFRTDGTLVVAYDGDDRAALADMVDRQRSMGLDVGDLTARDLRALEPALSPAVRRGVGATSERSVDPKALVTALLVAVKRAGATIVHERAVGLVDHAVQLADGSGLSAQTVVLAAGAWSADLDPVPVRPVKGQVVTLRQRPGDDVVHHVVRAFVRGSVVYVVPRDDGRLVCGATVEEMGWDRTPTAGAVYDLLRDVLSVFPGLDDAELVGVTVGFRPGTPDDLPVIGPSPAVDGLVLATGHYRNGILLTPLTAARVAAAVLEPEAVASS